MVRMSLKEARKIIPKEQLREPKYRNRKVIWKGMQFDSVRERNRFIILDADQQAGKISELRRQVRFNLIPAQRIDGKVVERACDYVADFVYRDLNGSLVVEDAKGFRGNPVWIIKRKLMLQKYGIRVVEV